jgi:CRP-like cAMP-binding protein
MLDEARATEAEPRAGGQVERILHLKQLPIIGTLPSSDLALVADRMTERFFKRGEWLLREGEPARAFYAVLDGNLHVTREGKTIGHSRPGGVVGGFAILGRDPRGLSVRAEADTLALEVEADAVFDILEDNFGIMHHVLREIARQLITTIARQPNPWAHIPIPPDPAVARPGELDLVERIFFMRNSSPFRRASINALAELSRGLTEVRPEAGTTLWKAGDPAGFVSLIVSGEVTCTTPAGAVQNLGPGTPLGSIEATAERPRWYTAVTRTPVTALNGPVDTLVDVFEDNFGMAMDYTAVMARWLMDTFESLQYGDAVLARLYGCEADFDEVKEPGAA